MQETIHGNAKRVEYIASLIERYQPKTVLDVGCGNGIFLTVPLAERFPSTDFLGIDSDRETIDLANTANTCANLRYATNEELQSGHVFDFVLASEVIEHVDDPESFLDWLHSVVAPQGTLVITTPNGYGPFEIVTFFETLLDLSGVMKFLSRLPVLRRFKVGDSYSSGDVRSMQHDTLAISPHVNFFSFGVLTSMFERRGFRLKEVRARSFLGGLGFNQLMKSQGVLAWNARVSDKLPRRFASGWMFVLEQRPLVSISPKRYKRRLNERLRRHLTALRWGTATKE